MKQYLLPVVSTLTLFTINTLSYAMSPAQIAQKQQQFRKNMSTLDDLNKKRQGFSRNATDTIAQAKNLIKELEPVIDTEWMQIALDEKLMNRENYYTTEVNRNIRDIVQALGLSTKIGSAMLEWSQEKDPFFKTVRNQIFNQIYQTLTYFYPINKQATTPTRTNNLLNIPPQYKNDQSDWLADMTRSKQNQEPLGGMFYWLHQSHQRFLSFANILGHSDSKNMFTASSNETVIINDLTKGLHTVLDNIYYGSNETPTKFATAQGVAQDDSILLIPKKSENMFDKSIQEVGGLLYHLNKDLQEYKSLMVFAGQGNKDDDPVFNTSAAMQNINKVINDLSQGYQIEIKKPYTFNNTIFAVYDAMYNKWADPIMSFFKQDGVKINNSNDAIQAIKNFAETTYYYQKKKDDTIYNIFDDSMREVIKSTQKNDLKEMQSAAQSIVGIPKGQEGNTIDDIIKNIMYTTLHPIEQAIDKLVNHSDVTKASFVAWKKDKKKDALERALYDRNTRENIITALTTIIEYFDKIKSNLIK